MRMGVAKRGYGDAAAEIEILAAVGRNEIGAFTPLERYVGPSVSRQNGWNHENLSGMKVKRESTTKRVSVVARALYGDERRAVPALPCSQPFGGKRKVWGSRA
jgi:hypothetical protein